MNVRCVLLASDLLIWLLVLASGALGVLSWRRPPLRAAWRRLARHRPGMAAATVLLVFVVIGLLDSLHFQPRLDNAANAEAVYAVEVLSLLDYAMTPQRTRPEKTYSEPLATRSYAKEFVVQRDAAGRLQQVRDFPRLKYGGAHLGVDEARRGRDVWQRAALAAGIAAAGFAVLTLGLAGILARRRASTWGRTWLALWRDDPAFAWNAVLTTLAIVLLVAVPLFALSVDYHVFGTDKVGQDVFYQVLKSVRTALVIGLLTTLVTLPLAIAFGVLAGYFGGWVDDLIQYLYTTLSSIPGVLLIAAGVLMMQVVIDAHAAWFVTAAERADLRLLALCVILGLSSWTSLCRLLRGETLKLRELEYIQAAQSFGVGELRILWRHVLPNLMHIVIIALVMDFSGLVLAEAVLSYVGIGVDASTHSFGMMINNARMELAREPVVWWSLAAAFGVMCLLVLAANLFADALRDAFDPRRG